MKAFCAGIVTYNPDIHRLRENISSIIRQVDHIVICDNGSRNINSIKEIIMSFPIRVIELNENMGIAYALNKICEISIELGYEWVLTLDQDSVSPVNLIKKLAEYANRNDVAIVSPEIIYRNNEKYSEREYGNSFDEVEWTITSSSLTNLNVWKKINGFDNKLFIDMVDYDYCVRARMAGFKVIRVHTVGLNHELGKLYCKRILGRVVHITNHSAFRYYYMARNNMILKKKLGVGKPIVENLKLIIKIIFFEDSKKEKVISIIKGIRDYKEYFKEDIEI